jgi:hypothetical protein
LEQRIEPDIQKEINNLFYEWNAKK